MVNALPVGYGGDKIFYNNFEQPQFSPTAWLFAPMSLLKLIYSVFSQSLPIYP
jgi:tryptophan-rich sensory protein